MRVLIRKRNSRQFLVDPDHWVEDRPKALDFVSSVMALDAATRMDLKEIEIVLDFGTPQTDVVLTVPDSVSQPPRPN